MRWIGLVVVMVAARTAAAEPVTYELRSEVSLGQKPQIRITAAENVMDVRIELDTDAGKHVRLSRQALAKGKSVTLDIGDGAAGKVAYKGTLSAKVSGATEPWKMTVSFETLVRPLVHVGYDVEHLDLDKHVLQFTMSRPAGSAELVALGEDGGELGKGSATYKQEAAGTWLSISWTQPATARVLKLKLRASSSDGGVSDVELIPWSVTIDHEDVNFATDSAVIDKTEDQKLAASVAKVAAVVKTSGQYVKMKLYVAGHTDTVGPGAKNRKLSLDRARAIAAYFRKQGIALPIAFAGFGEDVLKVQTKDDTDERANRRADYVIGPAGSPPPFRGPYLKAKASWQELR